MGLFLQHLSRYADEGEDMLNRIFNGDESWAHHYRPESKHASVQRKHPSSPSTKKLKVASTPSVGKVMLIVFWDSQGVLVAHFQKLGENVNSALYCEFLLKLQDAICRNIQANWQELYCFIMIMPDPIQPKQPRIEFKNYSENFLNVRLTVWTWPLVTSICLVR
jgi:hypothetical protein